MLRATTKTCDSQLIQDFTKSCLEETDYHATTPSSIFILFVRTPADNHENRELSTVRTDEKLNVIKNTPVDQLDFLSKKIGLNISQLADLLKVGRQSVYKWLAGARIRKKHLRRLDDLCKVFTLWDSIYPIKLGSYLYKKIAGKFSLYDLLSSTAINVEEARSIAKKINYILLEAAESAEKRQKKLNDAGFKSASKEQKVKILDQLIRKS